MHPGYFEPQDQRFQTQAGCYCSLPMAKEIISLPFRSRMALRYAFSPSEPYFISVTSVHHFSFTVFAVNSLFRMFSAVTSGCGSLVSRALSANNCQQANDMYQTVESLQIILLFVSGVVFVCNPAITVGTIMPLRISCRCHAATPHSQVGRGSWPDVSIYNNWIGSDPEYRKFQ